MPPSSAQRTADREFTSFVDELARNPDLLGSTQTTDSATGRGSAARLCERAAATAELQTWISGGA